MKNLKCLVQAFAAVGCGALILSLLGGDAAAGNKPPADLLWPNGAQVEAGWQYSTYLGFWRLYVLWPTTDAVDHYRLTAVGVTGKVANRVTKVIIDESPVTYTLLSDGRAQYYSVYMAGPSYYETVVVTVTAYDGPDEAVAHSESLQRRATIPRYYPPVW